MSPPSIACVFWLLARFVHRVPLSCCHDHSAPAPGGWVLLISCAWVGCQARDLAVLPSVVGESGRLTSPVYLLCSPVVSIARVQCSAPSLASIVRWVQVVAKQTGPYLRSPVSPLGKVYARMSTSRVIILRHRTFFARAESMPPSFASEPKKNFGPRRKRGLFFREGYSQTHDHRCLTRWTFLPAGLSSPSGGRAKSRPEGLSGPTCGA